MPRTHTQVVIWSGFSLLGLSGAALPLGPVGCATQRIAVAEAFGYAKREQLVDKVQAARDAQGEAKAQFASALKEFLAVTNAADNPAIKDLEARYDRLKSEHERSDKRAAAVAARIDSVEAVGSALFSEWRTELTQYSSDTLRRASEKQLHDTKAQYDRLLVAMRAAEGKMPPVLAAFKDQVLFLKHNLNARAIASLHTTSAQIQSDVAGLIREMEASIAEANRFIEQLGAAQ